MSEWLGDLIDYDNTRDADMVRTLSQFLECGGHYTARAEPLQVNEIIRLASDSHTLAA